MNRLRVRTDPETCQPYTTEQDLVEHIQALVRDGDLEHAAELLDENRLDESYRRGYLRRES
jgi:hypothetical protein